MPDDPTEGSRRPAVGVVSERVVRGRGGPRRQLQPHGLAVRRAHYRGDRGDNLNTLLSYAEALRLALITDIFMDLPQSLDKLGRIYREVGNLWYFTACAK